MTLGGKSETNNRISYSGGAEKLIEIEDTDPS